jgi:hypothetical protein
MTLYDMQFQRCGQLVVFISNTSDLYHESNAVEKALAEFDINGLRFESWSASPSPPAEKCLKRIEESDARKHLGRNVTVSLVV